MATKAETFANIIKNLQETITKSEKKSTLII